MSENIEELKSFQKLSNAFLNFFVISIFLIIIILLWSYIIKWPFDKVGIIWPLEAIGKRRILFICYMCIFGGVWVTYFLSLNEKTCLQIRSLRSLLSKTSRQWGKGDIPPKKNREFINSYYQKAQSSIAALAVMTATSVLVLGEVHNLFLKYSWCSIDIWGKTMIIAATISGTVSLISFVISIDSLDSIFNLFRTEAIEKKLDIHFYRAVINRRYVGLILMLLGVILIVAYHNPIISCILLSLFISIGYSHWFPNIKDPTSAFRQSSLIGSVLIGFAILFEVLFI